MALLRGWQVRALLAIGSTLIVGVIFLASIAEELRRQETERLDHEASLLALQWSSLWRDVAGNAQFLADTPPAQGTARAARNDGIDPVDGSTAELWRDRLESIFVALMGSRPNYQQVRLIGLENGGHEIVRVERTADGRVRRVPEGELQSKGSEPYHAEAREAASRGETEAFVTRVTLNREGGEIERPLNPVSRAVALVHDTEGVAYAFIIINLSLSPIFEAQTSELTPGHHLIITNGAGQPLYDSDIGLRFEFDLEGDPDWPAVGSSTLVGILPEIPNRVSQDPVDGRRALAAASLVEAAGISSEADMAVLMSAQGVGIVDLASDVLWARLPLLLAVLLATAAIGAYMSQRATRPFAELANSITRAGWGVGGMGGVPIPDNPEAAMIARAFNVAHDELALSLEELRQRNRELEQFTATASHDLQEPARTVRSFAALLDERYGDRLDDDGKAMLEFLSDSATRMQERIRAVLTHSRIGRSSEWGSVDCGELVSTIISDLGAAIDESGAEIEVAALPTIDGCQPELRLLFENLLSNAIKFRKEGETPTIRISGQRGDPHRFVVADDGIGIPIDQREKVFDFFRRGHSRDSAFEGSGIGLAHCRKIVEQHGGRIWVGDTTEGTEVHFTLSSKKRSLRD